MGGGGAACLYVGVGVVLVAEDVEAAPDGLNHGLEPVVHAHVAVLHLPRGAAAAAVGARAVQVANSLLSPLPGRSGRGSRFSEHRTRWQYRGNRSAIGSAFMSAAIDYISNLDKKPVIYL